ncbi:phosphatidate cytidylyltransferase [Azorhizobium oxalatiphilum]|uniref:Phosphatidate cytidylyltransferase n=1 Tax=Azorhizobium oxalatiphilum TaxID=980631 RepID=A0A917BXV5_9HYPH|nr:phosphatidate cytidylyltransferase [Azorhizobium oxalatiphilum]GGF59100.1 phosphatidate cytidylyltransferase [Azorhizobium oxalatiphilum]
MAPEHHTLALFCGVLAVLLLATGIGQLIARRTAAGGPNAVVQNLNARINAWWVMVGVLALAFLFGKGGVVVLFGLCAFAALREFITLTPTRRGDHYALALAFFVILPVQFWLVQIEWYGLYAIFIPVYVFLLLPVIAALRGDTSRFMERIAEVQWALMICVYCLSHVPALLTLPIAGYEGRGLLLIAFLVLVVQASDVLQYVWGKLFGRHKVAPALSPSKTWEGLIGGVLSATALGAALWWVTPFAPHEAALLAFVSCLMGFFGGLVMSAIKRDRGVKDWGQSIAGHGGFLDRLDSIVFSAPVFFHLTRYFWTI